MHADRNIPRLAAFFGLSLTGWLPSGCTLILYFLYAACNFLLQIIICDLLKAACQTYVWPYGLPGWTLLTNNNTLPSESSSEFQIFLLYQAVPINNYEDSK